MKYSALIIDVVESRKYENRIGVQEILRESIKYLNEIFSPSLEKEIIFSGGDEMQGLFKSSSAAFLYFRKLQLFVYPIKLRAGMGVGTIKYLKEKWVSTELDGEAYYNARDAINRISNKGENVLCYNSNQPEDKFINMLLLSSSDMKTRQSETSRLIELLLDYMFPIYDANAMKEESIGSHYEQIMLLKIDLLQSFKNKSRVKKQDDENNFNLYYQKLKTIKIYYDKGNETYLEKELYVDRFWKKGYSTIIADILETSRQNIDKHIASGKIKENRNMDGTVFLFLKERGEKYDL